MGGTTNAVLGDDPEYTHVRVIDGSVVKTYSSTIATGVPAVNARMTESSTLLAVRRSIWAAPVPICNRAPPAATNLNVMVAVAGGMMNPDHRTLAGESPPKADIVSKSMNGSIRE